MMHNDTTPAVRGIPSARLLLGHAGVGQHQWIRRNTSLYRAGDPVADCLLFIHAGSFKQYRTDETGASKITCFPARGDFLALDSIGLATHSCTAVALEDSEVYAISCAILRQQLTILHRLLALGIREMRTSTVQLHKATAEQRLAAFLLDRAKRHRRLEGTSPHFRLPMSRCDIGNHLHLSPESVSRVMHQFKQAGFILLENRDVALLDASALKSIINAAPPTPPRAARHLLVTPPNVGEPSLRDASSSASDAASPLPCWECETRGVCLPAGMSDADCARISGLMMQQHRLVRGDTLQGVNEPVRGRWYAIRSGQFKSFQADQHGKPCITRFASAGDLLGLDSLDLDHYADSTAALCDSTVCEFSYPQFIEAARHFPDLARTLECRLSKQLAQQQALALLVRCDYAEQKFAQFLSHQTWKCSGQDDQVPELHLALSRREIADYLDLTHATVTRMISRLQRLGIICVRYRRLRLLDRPGLHKIAEGQHPSSKGAPGMADDHAGHCPAWQTVPGIHLPAPE